MKLSIVAVSLLFSWSIAQAASFNCIEAKTNIEKMICADAELSNLDSQLMESYKRSISNPIDADSIKSGQRTWLKAERNKCQDAACIKQAYTSRIAVLDSLKPATPTSEPTTQTSEVSSAASTNASSQPQETSKEASAAQSNSASTASSPASASKDEKKQESNKTTQTDENGELVKPDEGIAGIFNVAYSIVCILFIIGLINPKWILRWDAAANRKKLFVYFFVGSFLTIGLSVLTKNEATKKYEVQVRAKKEAEIARQKAIEEQKIAQQREEAERQAAQQAYQQRAAEAARQARYRPKPLWQQYKEAINVQGDLCDTYRTNLENFANQGVDENQLNRLARDWYQQAQQTGCVQ